MYAVPSQVSNLSEEEDTESSAHKDLLSTEDNEKECPAAAKEAGQEDTPPTDWLSKLRSTVLEVNTRPLIIVFASELPPSLKAPLREFPSTVGESTPFHIEQLQSQLMAISAQEGRCSGEGGTREDTVLTRQAVVLCLPQLRLGSAISEAASLSDPIPREGARDSWPWQLQASGLSAYTFDGHRQHHIVKPAVCEVTLAVATPQDSPADSGKAGKDEGANSLAVHVNFQPLIVSVSRHQLELISSAVSSIQYAVLAQPTPSVDLDVNLEQTPNVSILDSSLRTPSQLAAAGVVGPAHVPSPALSVVSIATFPPGGSRSDEGSTTHSRQPSQGLHPPLLLWIQCTVPKVAVRMYSTQECGKEIKLEVTGENLVVSWDQQKAVCEGHFSMTGLDAVFLQRYSTWENVN